MQLTNLGTAPVTINSITTGPDFTVPSNTCGGQLAPGSCTINVAFKPTAGGQFNEFLTINDSDSSSPQTVALSGMGKALKASASTLSFGNQPVGATQQPSSHNADQPGCRCHRHYWHQLLQPGVQPVSAEFHLRQRRFRD